MPSNLVTQIAEIKNIRPHTDPEVEKLELCEVGGWQLVVGKGLYTENERVVFITPDTLIPEGLADILEIRQHLGSVKNPDGTFVTNDKGEVMLRVKQAKLRGEPSFGTTIPEDVMFNEYGLNINVLPLGANMATIVGNPLGVLKYEPAMRASAGDADVDHPLFTKYTSIENLRNYPRLFEDGELVVCSEKLHGQNLRIGIIEGEFLAGSHGLRRKRPENISQNAFWYPLEKSKGVKELLTELGKEHNQVILFGESYGNIQKKYTYNNPNGTEFRAFDLLIDGKYVDYEKFIEVCKKFEVNTVPILGIFPYSFEIVRNFSESIQKSALAEHPIEGVVIKPLKEGNNLRIGRKILKYVNDSFLLDKNKSDFTEV